MALVRPISLAYYLFRRLCCCRCCRASTKREKRELHEPPEFDYASAFVFPIAHHDVSRLITDRVTMFLFQQLQHRSPHCNDGSRLLLHRGHYHPIHVVLFWIELDMLKIQLDVRRTLKIRMQIRFLTRCFCSCSYVHHQKSESWGTLVPNIVSISLVTLLIYQITLLGIFIINNFLFGSIATGIMIGVTVIFWISIHKVYYKRTKVPL
jgi:hypothetical protein